VYDVRRILLGKEKGGGDMKIWGAGKQVRAFKAGESLTLRKSHQLKLKN